MRRFAWLAILLVPVAAGLAGCGGGGGAKDRASGLTPAELVRQSAAATNAAAAYRLAATGTLQADIAPGRVPALAVSLLKTPVKVDGEGPVNGDALSFDFGVTLQGLPPIQANVTKVGGKLFVGLLGTDYTVDVPAAQVAAFRPADLAGGLLAWATDASEVAREKVDGVPTVHLTATIDVRRALTAAASVVGSLQASPVSPKAIRDSIPQLENALQEHTIDLWIGTADLLPRREVVKLRFDGTVKALPEIRSAALDLDARLSDFGTAVTITAPQATQALDLNRLRSLAP